jgi:uncharacterized protein
MDAKYVEKHIIFEAIVGSRAYGIHHEESDHDRAGVMIPGLINNLGFEYMDEFRKFPEGDRVIFEIKKAMLLIADNNPNLIDLLWMPDRCVLMMTEYWAQIIARREEFLSKRCGATYSGYAIQQLRRIKTHRQYLLNPPKTNPTREAFDLPSTSYFKTAHLKSICRAALELIPNEKRNQFSIELDALYSDYVIPLIERYVKDEEHSMAMLWLQSSIKSQINSFRNIKDTYLKDEFVDMAKKELAYQNAYNEWKRYQQWKKNRKKKRAVLEERYGFDLKHATHLIRILRMGEEILTKNKVFVDRTNIDAEELKTIRDGAWSFEQVEEYVEKMDVRINKLVEQSNLPLYTDRSVVEKLCLDTIKRYHTDHNFEF